MAPALKASLVKNSARTPSQSKKKSSSKPMRRFCSKQSGRNDVVMSLLTGPFSVGLAKKVGKEKSWELPVPCSKTKYWLFWNILKYTLPKVAMDPNMFITCHELMNDHLLSIWTCTLWFYSKLIFPLRFLESNRALKKLRRLPVHRSSTVI